MRKFKLISLIFFGLFILSEIVLAQSLPLIASNFEVADLEAKPGDIISKSEGGLIRSTVPYDSNLFGIVVENPIMVFNKQTTSTLSILSQGEALVKVSNTNGEIKRRDFITSSNKAGVGQKATESGFVIGTALEKFNEEEGIIKVSIEIQYANIGPIGIMSKSVFGSIFKELKAPENLPQTMRYLFALLLGGGSFLLGFFFFAKISRKGIEGVSRNPLAKESIRLTVLLNLIGIVVLTLAGLALATFVILY